MKSIFCFVIVLGSSTLPRATSRGTETEIGRNAESKVAAATSSTSIYDNVTSGNQSGQTTAQGVYICSLTYIFCYKYQSRFFLVICLYTFPPYECVCVGVKDSLCMYVCV